MRKTALALYACLLSILMAASVSAEAPILRGYEKGQGYCYLFLGSYPYEKDGGRAPVLWRILSAGEEGLLLITDQVIDTAQVIREDDPKVIEKRSYRRIARFNESDLYQELKEISGRMFGDTPLRKAIKLKNGTDELFLLSQEEFLEPAYGFSPNMWNVQKTRWAKGTPWAIHQRGLYEDPSLLTSPYWTSRIQSAEGYKLQIVGYNGHLSWGAYTRVNIGIRPSVLLDASRVSPIAGAGTQEDPFLLELIQAAQDSDTSAP